MSTPLREAGLWSGAAVLALAGHVAAGAWLIQAEPRVGDGPVDPMPVEIIMEAPPDIPPDAPSQAVSEVAPPPVPDAAPELAPAPDVAPVIPPVDLPEPELAEVPPTYEPPPPPPPALSPEVTSPVTALAPPPPEPLDLALATDPPPDAVALPMPVPLDMTPPDLAEALPEIQLPPPEPEEEISDSAVALALRPPARPDRPAPRAPEALRPAPAPAPTPAPTPAPQAPAAPAAAPAPAAPSPGEIQTWQSQAQRRIARHMQSTRLPAGRGQVQASLSISVAANGATSAALAGSTGNPEADAALQRQASSMPSLPPPPGGQAVTLSVPVVVSFR